MSIHADTVKHVATLARLHVSEEDVDLYTGQLSRILELMEALSLVSTEDVPPMSHAVEMCMPEREDQVRNGNQRDALLACAFDSEQGFFRVPKIIE